MLRGNRVYRTCYKNATRKLLKWNLGFFIYRHKLMIMLCSVHKPEYTVDFRQTKGIKDLPTFPLNT